MMKSERPSVSSSEKTRNKTHRAMATSLLIIGLGNPGEEYEMTRHNAGAISVRRLATHLGVPFETKPKLFAEITETKGKGRRLILACPTTYMNQSGKSAAALSRFFKVPPRAIVVVHDDMDLALGTIKIVENRGAGGHKGVKSVFRALGTQDIARVRIGTMGGGRNQRPGRRALDDLVVRKLTAEERRALTRGTRKAAEALETILIEGLATAMTTYNR